MKDEDHILEPLLREGKLPTEMKVTAPPNVHEGIREGTYCMVLSTDAGAIFVGMNEEHFEELHLQVLRVEIDQAIRSNSLDRWHNELDDMVDELVELSRLEQEDAS